ncbi:MAG: DUF2207 domain-containing protein [Patescibacteria group bacterium]
MKKPLLFPVLLLPLLLALAPPAGADGGERILSYHSEIAIQKDASMIVRETIRVQSEGIEIRRGIYRDFPTRYRDRMGNRYIVDFQMVEALRDGQPEHYRVTDHANGKRVYIGREEVILPPGRYTYTLTYRTDRQLGFFDDHDELYWNAVGNGWSFPIDAATAVVSVPGATLDDLISAYGYTGPQGSTVQDVHCALEEGGRASYTATTFLAPYEGLTIVLSWRKGLIAPPGNARKLGWLLRDNFGLVVAILGLAGILFFYLAAWRKVGRDPARGTIIPRFAPPEGFSPASVRYVARMGYDQKIMAATIINMAVKGCATIREEDKVFTVTRVPGREDALTPAEAKVAARLFRDGDAFSFTQANHAAVADVINQLRSYLKAKFQKTLFNTNSGYFGLGILASALLFVFGLMSMSAGTLAAPFLFLEAALLAAVNIVFYRLLKAPTRAGRRVMDEIEGFKMYLSVAEKDRLNLLNPPEETPALFEKYLPYALALDVEQRWAERFAGVLARSAAGGREYQPAWYYGTRWHSARPGEFASSVGGSFAGAISASSTPPGSSSGGGGGGFSGGGGGGGGGGGW